MITFIDISLCDSNCNNKLCFRFNCNLTSSPTTPTFDFSKDCDEYQKPIVTWCPSDGPFLFNGLGGVFEQDGDPKLRSYGLKRATRKSAELAADRSAKTNRLSALAHELGGELPFHSDASNSTIEFYKGQAVPRRSDHVNIVGQVYMTPGCAVTICEMINSGQVVL